MEKENNKDLLDLIKTIESSMIKKPRNDFQKGFNLALISLLTKIQIKAGVYIQYTVEELGEILIKNSKKPNEKDIEWAKSKINKLKNIK